MRTLGPRTVGQELHGACRLAERNAEAAFDGIGVEAQQLTRRRHRAKDSAGRRRVETAVVVIGRTEGQREADLNFITSDAGGDQVLTGRAGHLRRRQCRRHDGCGRMQ
jgi:hypothetical protein